MITREELRQPSNEYKMAVRWWLAEGFHTDETLKNDIRLLDECGVGAVEFLALEAPGADSRLYGWGAEEWVHDSMVVFDETTKRNMGVSATCGTNWANCNLTGITPDDKAAAKELDFMLEILAPGEKRSGKLPECPLTMEGVTRQELVAVVATRLDREDTQEQETYLDPEHSLVLTDRVKNGELEYEAPSDGTYYLFFFYIHGTGQTAGPSASVSYTVNYMDRYGIEAFKAYWDQEVLTQQLRETIRKNGHAMMYMDSLEISTFCKGGQFWGYHILEEFEKRRGYDLTPYLPFIVKESGMMMVDFVYHYNMEDQILREKIINDLYETMTDLYMDNMMQPMMDWCHSHGMELRSEISYGLPFEISRPGRCVDGIETESLEFAAQIDSYRGLAGPAHVYDKIYSSETGATRQNYMMGLDFYTQMIFTQFAAGVTRTVLHGYSSIAGSEASTYWPGHEGMWPIFSERFGSRQPAYLHYPEWNRMVARYQKVLRSGKPRMDLAMLRLDYNFHNLYGRNASPVEQDYYAHQGMRNHEAAYWKDMTLQDHGFTWDYFAPQLLEEEIMVTENGLLMPEGPAYQAVIVYQDTLPYSSAQKLYELARQGLPVLFVNHTRETVRPLPVQDKVYEKAASRTPFRDGLDGKLAELVAEMKKLPCVREVEDQSRTYEALIELGVHPRTEFEEENGQVLTLTRQDGETTYVYLYNMQYAQKEGTAVQVKIPAAGAVYQINCWNGEITELGSYQSKEGKTVLKVSLAPGQAALYAVDASRRPSVHAEEMNGCAELSGGALIGKIFESGVSLVRLSDGRQVQLSAEVPADIDLPVWKLTVEDWNEGEKKTIVEDRGLGIITREVYYETAKNRIEVGETKLIPWKDIEKVGPKVSGVGHYETTVILPDDFDESLGVILQLGSINKCTASVGVGDEEAVMIDMDGLSIDLSGKLHAGANTLRVDVSSSLKNRLLSRGYYDKSDAESKKLEELASNGYANGEAMKKKVMAYKTKAIVRMDMKPVDYGMTGSAVLKFYRKVRID